MEGSKKKGTFSTALFVGLNVTNLPAVGAFARRARDLLSRRFRRTLVCARHGAARDFGLELLLLLALLTSLFVLLQSLLLFPGPVRSC